MDKCAKCGHVRYPGDQFDGVCSECEAWAQYRIEALEAFVAEVEAAWMNITTREFAYDEDKDKFVTWFIGYEHKEKIDAALTRLKKEVG